MGVDVNEQKHKIKNEKDEEDEKEEKEEKKGKKDINDEIKKDSKEKIVPRKIIEIPRAYTPLYSCRDCKKNFVEYYSLVAHCKDKNHGGYEDNLILK